MNVSTNRTHAIYIVGSFDLAPWPNGKALLSGDCQGSRNLAKTVGSSPIGVEFKCSLLLFAADREHGDW